MIKRNLLAAASAPVVAACIAGSVPTTAAAQTVPAQTEPQTPAPDQTTGVANGATANPSTPQPDDVIVTGSTSRRTLLDASVAVTNVTQKQLLEKAPRSTDDILETIPGIFVQATAGPVSNNYSVRGLPGGSQQFVRLLEDGMPVIYGGLNDDEVFQYDISIDHVEGLEGGTSGILAPNAAGASINFISRPLNYDHASGIVRALGSTYGEGRGDAWVSAPLANNLAFAVSGYYDNTPGVRSSPFRYGTWHLKAQLEKRFDSGGSVRLTYKHWNEHDPYYADQPYAYNNGQISSVPSLGTQFGNIIGRDFANIVVPDSVAAGEPTRTFSEAQGIHATGNEGRIDFDKPVTEGLRLFARVRYTQTDWDFNGVFAGSGTGNGGLTSAASYLDPVNSPIASLLQQGLTAFPGTTSFGIRKVSNGQLIPASNTAALNALNGNGLLQQTVLNRQLIRIRDWGSDFGWAWTLHGDRFSNSLTVGGMIFSQHLDNDQSAVSAVLNDVRNNSSIYDVVALNSAGAVLGSLTNNGLLSYGDWGQGISNYDQQSESVYVNDEFTFADKLHLDVGMRYENEHEVSRSGGSTAQAVPATYPGIIRTNPNAFDGTFTTTRGDENPFNWTVGANYTFSPRFSIYARYADSYQTQGVNPKATELKLYEAGITFSKFDIFGSVRGFRTEFNNTSFGGGVDPANPNLNQGFFADLIANGMTLDLTYRPSFIAGKPFSIQAQATYQDSEFNNVTTGVITAGGQNISQQVQSFYNGKNPALTPTWLFTIQPTYDLPRNLGSVYARVKYIDSIFADNGNALALPSYTVLSVGALFNVRHDLQLGVSGDNLTNALGLTEGNPRQGFTQQVVSGYFYGRGIIGPNAQVSLTYKF